LSHMSLYSLVKLKALKEARRSSGPSVAEQMQLMQMQQQLAIQQMAMGNGGGGSMGNPMLSNPMLSNPMMMHHQQHQHGGMQGGFPHMQSPPPQQHWQQQQQQQQQQQPPPQQPFSSSYIPRIPGGVSGDDVDAEVTNLEISMGRPGASPAPSVRPCWKWWASSSRATTNSKGTFWARGNQQENCRKRF
jgi:hypothetical protein